MYPEIVELRFSIQWLKLYGKTVKKWPKKEWSDDQKIAKNNKWKRGKMSLKIGEMCKILTINCWKLTEILT